MERRAVNSFIIFILLFGFCGCDNEHKPLPKQVLHPTDPNRPDPADLLALYYPYLDLVPIEPNSSEYHADRLARTYRPDTAAHNIIAIGMLQQDTPHVRRALAVAIKRFYADPQPVPNSYDWPDLAKNFKSHFDPAAPILDHYPGCRNLTIIDLIIECSYYLGCQDWAVSQVQTIANKEFTPKTHLDSLQFLTEPNQ
ncbi:MAG: hypothetical protein PHF37_02350 [Phycisphaerae bacterium]|nr:hypothetical protein [Phycisphaerae bacterium]